MALGSAFIVDMDTSFGHGEVRNVSEEPKLLKEDPQETRHLKELLLLHLDWIQQQQETLLAKDRLIMRLKQEKEALKCRLERMDRRISLLKQKNSTCPRPNHANDVDVMHKDVTGAGSSSAPPAGRGQNPNRGHKRKHSMEPKNLASKFDDIDMQKSDSNGTMVNKSTSTIADTCTEVSPLASPSKQKTSRLSRSEKLKDSPLKQAQFLFSQQPPRKCRNQTPTKQQAEPSADHAVAAIEKDDVRLPKNIKVNPQLNDSDTDDEVQFLDQSARKRLPRISTVSLPRYHDNKILRTDTMYYVPALIELPPWDISPKQVKPDHVVVPTWKIKHIPTGYQLEGTENLTDEIYLKRHQKPEADEKRRKRWDAQMIREKKMVERLQQRGSSVLGPGTPSQNSHRKDDEEELDSFLPNPDNVKYLEICDEVPVTAFGYPVPEFTQSDFSLPWFDASKATKDGCHSRSSRGHKKPAHH